MQRSSEHPAISIHAPAKGATTGVEVTGIVSSISIHAPAKGATKRIVKSWDNGLISIHAPAKGATGMRLSVSWKLCNFNPRSREGSDVTNNSNTAFLHYFNPRSREGSDDVEKVKGAQEELFQSTLPRRERQVRVLCKQGLFTISIHAPAKGATSHKVDSRLPAFIFQSTLPRRERR